jgi:DNA polymerase-1
VFLLIDGNNLAWAGFYALERAMKPEDEERRHRVAMLGLAGGLLGTIARGGTPPDSHPADSLSRVAICFDDGRPLRRRQIYAPYQTGRERDPKFVQNEPTILRAIAEFSEMAADVLPLEILRGMNVEADDLVAGLVSAHHDAPKRIVSTDRDFYQLIGPSVSVYAPVKKLIVDDSNFDDVAWGKRVGPPRPIPRERFLDYRAVTGDTSDDLPGVPGVGPGSAQAMLRRAPLDSYFGNARAVQNALGRRSLVIEKAFRDGSAREVVDRNRTLMDLRLPAPCWSELDTLTRRGRWQRDAFERWLDDQRISNVDRKLLMPRMEQLATVGGA